MILVPIGYQDRRPPTQHDVVIENNVKPGFHRVLRIHEPFPLLTYLLE